jgi:hypothetical protein
MERRSIRWNRPTRQLVLAFIFVGLTLTLVGLRGPSEILAADLFFGLPLLVGILIGEWWATLLALTWFVVAAAHPFDEGGVERSMYYAAIAGVPLSAVMLATGVALRRLARPYERLIRGRR